MSFIPCVYASRCMNYGMNKALPRKLHRIMAGKRPQAYNQRFRTMVQSLIIW